MAAPETKFNVEIFPSLLAPKGLRVQAGDYVGNGKNQLLLAIKTDESNGMAVQSWKLVVIDDLKVSKPLNVVDFGVMSYSTEPKAGGKCRILASEWREGWEPRRGNGLYIVGRWLEFFDGRFSVTSSRPILFHRYLFSLEQKRLSAMSEIHHMPVLWFKSDGARIVIGPDPLP